LPRCRRRIGDRRIGENLETELDGIASRGVRELVDEALEGEGEAVALWRALRAGRHA
jgi:hypothetical protein